MREGRDRKDTGRESEAWYQAMANETCPDCDRRAAHGVGLLSFRQPILLTVAAM